jgi:hypothetical protein
MGAIEGFEFGIRWTYQAARNFSMMSAAGRWLCQASRRRRIIGHFSGLETI